MLAKKSKYIQYMYTVYTVYIQKNSQKTSTKNSLMLAQTELTSKVNHKDVVVLIFCPGLRLVQVIVKVVLIETTEAN